MAKSPFGAFPPNPYSPQNPMSLPNWMRRNLEAGWAARQRAKEFKQRLSPAVRGANPLTPQQRQELRRQLFSRQRREITLSAESVRRLKTTLRSAHQAITRAASPADRPTLVNLYRWEKFLDKALSP